MPLLTTQDLLSLLYDVITPTNLNTFLLTLPDTTLLQVADPYACPIHHLLRSHLNNLDIPPKHFAIWSNRIEFLSYSFPLPSWARSYQIALLDNRPHTLPDGTSLQAYFTYQRIQIISDLYGLHLKGTFPPLSLQSCLTLLKPYL